MTELISAAEMDAIREVPMMGMQTVVSVLRLELVGISDGDDQQVWTEAQTVKGWIYEPLDYPRGNTTGGVQGTAQEYRAYLPVETDLSPGDRLGVEGVIYNVTDTNDGDTYRPMLRVALRKVV